MARRRRALHWWGQSSSWRECRREILWHNQPPRGAATSWRYGVAAHCDSPFFADTAPPMVGWILKKVIGSKNQREIKRMMPVVRRINELDEQFKTLSDDELRAKTAQWQTELAQMADPDEQWQKLNEILPEAFAVVKNGARRQIG